MDVGTPDPSHPCTERYAPFGALSVAEEVEVTRRRAPGYGMSAQIRWLFGARPILHHRPRRPPQGARALARRCRPAAHAISSCSQWVLAS